MNYESKESKWFPVDIYMRDINGQRVIQTIPDMSLVCQFVEELENRDEEEILMVVVDGICIYSQLGNNPITWDDITGFFA